MLSVFSLMFLLGCGATAVRAIAVPVEPPNVITTECLEVTAPAGWTLIKAETHRLGEVSGQGQTEEMPFSAMKIRHDATDQEISIVHAHGDGGNAEYMFVMSYLTFVMTEAMLPENRELFAREGITSMTVSEPVEASTVSGGLMFSVTRVSPTGVVDEGRVLTLLLVADDPNSRIILTTNVPVTETEQFPEMVLTVARTLRFLCGD